MKQVIRVQYVVKNVVKWGSLFVLVLVVFTMDTAQDMIDLILPAGPKVVIGPHSIKYVFLVLVKKGKSFSWMDHLSTNTSCLLIVRTAWHTPEHLYGTGYGSRNNTRHGPSLARSPVHGGSDP